MLSPAHCEPVRLIDCDSHLQGTNVQALRDGLRNLESKIDANQDEIKIYAQALNEKIDTNHDETKRNAQILNDKIDTNQTELKEVVRTSAAVVVAVTAVASVVTGIYCYFWGRRSRDKEVEAAGAEKKALKGALEDLAVEDKQAHTAVKLLEDAGEAEGPTDDEEVEAAEAEKKALKGVLEDLAVDDNQGHTAVQLLEGAEEGEEPANDEEVEVVVRRSDNRAAAEDWLKV